ncbi:hypothetical protein FQN60_015695 [Etheostoma spectabile]|uniref:Uncharacterized protein n=1 Tax=Etheostoma spectabile TaxID=54343 RepID=A0A5J5CQJ4_9PERO|nr:hypothetical protein FQN60_015695 [Etheostoma spectabile]
MFKCVQQGSSTGSAEVLHGGRESFG